MSGEFVSTWQPPPRYQFDEDGFILPPFKENQFPFIVAVAGGCCYSEAEAKFVRRKVLALLSLKRQTHNISLHLAPTPGAARIIFDAMDGHRSYCPQVIYRARELWGRAADFRAAFSLMDNAHALILFEPFDLIARYAKLLAELVPDRDGREGRGVRVAVVKRPTVIPQRG